ncbi:MAG: CRISPR-associated helicase Cas3' [Theionarchaea archaeon]|nr:CRISPR-associated helicase Cas3' [Theionarchaea archaeon]
MQANEIFREIESFKKGKFSPYKYQEEIWELIARDDPELSGITLLSGTGSGKTEAVLLPALFNNKRLILVYPTRSLVEDQIGRIGDYIKIGIISKRFEEKTLIVDLGDRKEALQIRKFDQERDLGLIKKKLQFWAKKVDSEGNSQLREVTINKTRIENPNVEGIMDIIAGKIKEVNSFEIQVRISPYTKIEIRESSESNFSIYQEKSHFYGGDVILTTLDEFVYRFLGYGGKHNLLYPLRLVWGYMARKNLLIAFDEAHSYESVAYTNFINLVFTLVSYGIKAVVMSATLPQDLVPLLEEKLGFIFIRGEEHSGKKDYEIAYVESDERTDSILNLAQTDIQKRIIIVRNTVSDAFDTYSKLNTTPEANGQHMYNGIPVFLYHGRLFSESRRRVYRQVKALDEARKPYILITTHAIEVGCDLDSDLLITDFCNPDQLIQRAGRCGRKEGTRGKIYVVGTDFTQKDEFMKVPDMDYERYVEILKKNQQTSFPARKIQEEVVKPRLVKDELSNALFGYLSAFIYEFDRTREELHNSGFVITRSWVPSARFFWARESTIDDLRELIEAGDYEDLFESLKEKKLLYGYDYLSVSLEQMASSDINKDEIKDVLVVAFSQSGKGSSVGRVVYSEINPYIDDICVFYCGNHFPNHNPWSAGLISVPKIFEKSEKGVIGNLNAPSQVLLDKNRKMWIKYLIPQSLES